MSSKKKLIQELAAVCADLISLLKEKPDFEAGPEGKWTTGQHAYHLIKSVQPLNQALGLPKLAISTMFGKSKSGSTSAQGVITKYQNALAEGGQATGKYVPKPILNDRKDEIFERLSSEYQKLQSNLDKWKEEDLDKYRLPHPLIGKLTIREMIYFTIYHTEHHIKTLKEQY